MSFYQYKIIVDGIQKTFISHQNQTPLGAKNNAMSIQAVEDNGYYWIYIHLDKLSFMEVRELAND